MAEVLAIIGGVAAFTQLASTLTKLSSKLRHCVESMRCAPQEIEHFRQELIIFAGSLRHFKSLCDDWLNGMAASPKKDEHERYVAAIITECKLVVKGFKTFKDKFFGPNTPPITLDWIERLKWYLRKKELTGLTLSLSAAKGSVSLCTTSVICENLIKRIEELVRENKEISRELRREKYVSNALSARKVLF